MTEQELRDFLLIRIEKLATTNFKSDNLQRIEAYEVIDDIVKHINNNYVYNPIRNNTMRKYNYKFVGKWDENTSNAVEWQKLCRIELNKIIQVYNDWQIVDEFNIDKITFVLANIEYGKQTIGKADGGECYMEDLIAMENFVNETKKELYHL